MMRSDLQWRSNNLHAVSSENALDFIGRGRASEPPIFPKRTFHIASRLIGETHLTLSVPKMSERMRDLSGCENRIPSC